MDIRVKRRAGLATVKVRNAAAIPDTLREFGVEPDDVLRRAGIEPRMFSNGDNAIPYVTLGRLAAECLRATGREDFGLRVGMRTGPTAMGLTGLLSMHAPTVRSALRVIVEGLGTSDTGGVLVLDERGAKAECGYVIIAPNIECADQIVDASMAILLNTMRQFCGSGWRPDLVRLTRGPPRDRIPFAKFFEAPIDYGAPAAAFVFPAAVLEAPVPDRKPEYAQILAPFHDEALADAHADFISSVRSIIRGQVGSGALSRDRVCRALGLSARTMAHRLESYGVTYSSLADEARYEAARSLLLKDKSITEIASILGFSEPSAFTRAFKAWSGATPARWRSGRLASHGAATTR